MEETATEGKPSLWAVEEKKYRNKQLAHFGGCRFLVQHVDNSIRRHQISLQNRLKVESSKYFPTESFLHKIIGPGVLAIPALLGL